MINPYDDWLARAIVRAATPYSVRYDGHSWWVLGVNGWRMRRDTLAGARSTYTALRDGWLRIQRMAA